MTEKELKKLGRPELLEMLLEQSKELDAVQKKLLAAQKQIETLQGMLREKDEKLADRAIKLDQAGSIAEAALQLSGIFDTAQQAAEEYLENVRTLSGRQQEICEKLEAESRQKADQLLAQTQVECDRRKLEAKKEADRYWNEVSEKLENFYQSHVGLRELLSVHTAPGKQNP